MDYSKLINQLTAEMKKGIQYKRLPLLFRIFAIIAVAPIIVTFILSKLLYWVTLFLYKMISSPAEYLHQWLKDQKDEVQHATQAVMYWICLPFIFSLQILLSLNAISFYIQWFFIMIQAYLLTLGGIKWQPFITEATFEEDAEYDLQPKPLFANIFSCAAFGSLAFYVIFAIITSSLLTAVNNGTCNFEVFKAFSDITTVFSKIYAILIFIVNPILFKKTIKK